MDTKSARIIPQTPRRAYGLNSFESDSEAVGSFAAFHRRVPMTLTAREVVALLIISDGQSLIGNIASIMMITLAGGNQPTGTEQGGKLQTHVVRRLGS